MSQSVMNGDSFIIVNGTNMPISGNETVQSVIGRLNMDPTRIAVELNGDICPRTDYDSVILKKGDVMEIVSFVGGG